MKRLFICVLCRCIIFCLKSGLSRRDSFVVVGRHGSPVGHVWVLSCSPRSVRPTFWHKGSQTAKAAATAFTQTAVNTSNPSHVCIATAKRRVGKDGTASLA